MRIGDPSRGASIITRLATDPAFAGVTGGCFSVEDAAPLGCLEPGRGVVVQRELCEAIEELLS